MANTHFPGRFAYFEIIETNCCSTFTFPNLYVKQKLDFRTHLKATEISHYFYYYNNHPVKLLFLGRAWVMISWRC